MTSTCCKDIGQVGGLLFGQIATKTGKAKQNKTKKTTKDNIVRFSELPGVFGIIYGLKQTL
jgi:hypothetical protein